jgi:enterochelin esterase family protein
VKVTITVPDWATHVLSDLTDMARKPHPVDARKVRKFTLELPDDAYFEYGFWDQAQTLKPDPENPIKADNPWYPGISAIIGDRYVPSPYAAPSAQAEGAVKRWRYKSSSLAETRRIISYTPAGYDAEALPAVYLQDGVAYYRIARLPEVLEALLAAKEIRPAHLIFIEPNDRTLEYRYNPHYRSFVTEELLPFIAARLAVTDERIAMGASLGGLVSATLAIAHPELFQTVISQSGAFVGSPDEPDYYTGKTSWVLETLAKQDALPLRWYVETGTLEWLADINRKLRDMLNSKGYAVSYRERNAGHNWVNWRNGLADALRFALPCQRE